MLRLFIGCTCCLLLSMVAIASDTLKLSIAQWTFEEIQADNLVFDIKLTTQGLGLIAHADSIQLPAPIGRLNKLELQCDELLIQAEQFSCIKGQMTFNQKELGQQTLAFNIVASPDNEQYQLSVTGLSLASAVLTINANLAKEKWQVNMATPQASLASLINFISPYLQEPQIQTLKAWGVDGNMTLSAQLSGRDNELDVFNMNLASTTLNVSDTQGQYVTENIAMTWLLALKKNKNDWQWQTDLIFNDGQGYAEPIFIDFANTPVALQANGAWQQQEGKLIVTNAEVDHHSITQLTGRFSGNFDQIELLDLVIKETDIALLYQNWLQPFLTGTAADSIELAGVVDLNYHQQNNDYHLSLAMDKVFVSDEAGRFSFDNISGTLGWANYDHTMLSDLKWQCGYIYAIPVGSSRIQAKAQSSILNFTKPWQLPILDGELQINEFSLQHSEGEHTQWTFDGLLTPISMESLSSALAWPELHGKLSGVIPKVSYTDQNIKVDGALMVKLFDGTTVIRDLQLNKPFGALPQLYANIDLMGLDLETLTQTFDFGKITGKLDGRMRNVRLSNWQPVQFDANFATPEGDKSRRRISQKAVDNLSQIGGGASSILSRSFLRFFEDFSYQRLGLSCQLRNEVCEMSGVGEAEQGYYIVKGGGLPPRINVVGYTRRVNWPDLIERLQAVSESSGPVVQ